MYKPERTCKICKQTKKNIHFYRTRGNKCIGCCLVEKFAISHNIDDIAEARQILTNKYSSKLEQLEKDTETYKYKLQEITNITISHDSKQISSY